MKLSDKLKRPLKIIHDITTPQDRLIADLLWSNPTNSDGEFGIQDDGTKELRKFGPDAVENFLARNSLSFIVRGHQCVMDGFEEFALFFQQLIIAESIKMLERF